MGQCYYVEAKFKFKNNDPESFCKAVQNEIKERNGISADFDLDGKDLNDPFGCFSALTVNAEIRKGCYCAAFDCCYGWEGIMYDVFSSAMKALDDDSKLTVWPDHGSWTLIVKNGNVKTKDSNSD